MAASDPIDIPAGVPGDRVDALYGLPLDEFTPARDALAKELRQAGDREPAGWVKALRKPSAAAWVVNQLARTQAREAERLRHAGEGLRDAQERLLAGDAGADELRRAAGEVGEAVGALLTTAPGLLDRGGDAPSGPTLERAGETLRSVALDERTREEFTAGRLTRERPATGLGLAGGATPPARAASKAGAGAKKRPRADGSSSGAPASEGRAERRAAARAALKDARADLRGRQRATRGADRELEQARAEAERARRRIDKAAGALERARSAEAEAEARVAEAEAEAAAEKAS